MSYLQIIEEQQYSEAARFDRFDGFDRGDLDSHDADFRDQGVECIGRQRAEWGGKVEVFREWSDDLEIFAVVLTFADGRVSRFDDFPEGRASALACGRWWLNGCPA